MGHQATTFLDYNITPTVHSVGAVKALQEADQSYLRTFPVHLKIDTGMGRIGALPSDVDAIGREVARSKSLILEGVFTHFSKADEKDKTYTKKQVETFASCVEQLKKHNLNPKCAGADTFHLPWLWS